MNTFTTIRSEKHFSKKANTFCTIDKVIKDGTKLTYFTVRSAEGKNVSGIMYARKYNAEKIVDRWFKHLENKC